MYKTTDISDDDTTQDTTSKSGEGTPTRLAPVQSQLLPGAAKPSTAPKTIVIGGQKQKQQSAEPRIQQVKIQLPEEKQPTVSRPMPQARIYQGAELREFQEKQAAERREREEQERLRQEEEMKKAEAERIAYERSLLQEVEGASFLVIHNYEATNPGDLGVKIGDKVVLLGTRSDGWWRCVNTRAETGYLPKNVLNHIPRKRPPNNDSKDNKNKKKGWFGSKKGSKDAGSQEKDNDNEKEKEKQKPDDSEEQKQSGRNNAGLPRPSITTDEEEKPPVAKNMKQVKDSNDSDIVDLFAAKTSNQKLAMKIAEGLKPKVSQPEPEPGPSQQPLPTKSVTPISIPIPTTTQNEVKPKEAVKSENEKSTTAQKTAPEPQSTQPPSPKSKAPFLAKLQQIRFKKQKPENLGESAAANTENDNIKKERSSPPEAVEAQSESNRRQSADTVEQNGTQSTPFPMPYAVNDEEENMSESETSYSSENKPPVVSAFPAPTPATASLPSITPETHVVKRQEMITKGDFVNTNLAAAAPEERHLATQTTKSTTEKNEVNAVRKKEKNPFFKELSPRNATQPPPKPLQKTATFASQPNLAASRNTTTATPPNVVIQRSQESQEKSTKSIPLLSVPSPSGLQRQRREKRSAFMSQPSTTTTDRSVSNDHYGLACHLFPRLSESNLNFHDIYWNYNTEANEYSIRKRKVRICKNIKLSVEQNVTAENIEVHAFLFDKRQSHDRQIVSNILKQSILPETGQFNFFKNSSKMSIIMRSNYNLPLVVLKIEAYNNGRNIGKTEVQLIYDNGRDLVPGKQTLNLQIDDRSLGRLVIQVNDISPVTTLLVDSLPDVLLCLEEHVSLLHLYRCSLVKYFVQHKFKQHAVAHDIMLTSIPRVMEDIVLTNHFIDELNKQKVLQTKNVDKFKEVFFNTVFPLLVTRASTTTRNENNTVSAIDDIKELIAKHETPQLAFFAKTKAIPVNLVRTRIDLTTPHALD